MHNPDACLSVLRNLYNLVNLENLYISEKEYKFRQRRVALCMVYMEEGKRVENKLARVFPSYVMLF